MAILPDPNGTDSSTPDHIRDEIEKVVIEQVPELVHQSVMKEEERRFRQIKWIAVFISVVGLGTFGTLATFMIEKIVDAKAGGIKETLELTRINGLALSLKLGKGISPNERDEAMALLTRISRSPNVKASPDVRTALSDILSSFASAELEAEIDQLFSAFQDEIVVNGLSSEILLHHYGQHIVGRSTKPATDDFALKAFERLERVAAGHELLELALAYRMLYESRSKVDESRIKNLLALSLDLSERDSVRFMREILIRTRATNWQNEPTAQGKTFERVTRQFFSAYKKAILDIYKAESGLVDNIVADGVSDGDAQTIAMLFVTGAGKRVGKPPASE